jgi:hypothetical protein
LSGQQLIIHVETGWVKEEQGGTVHTALVEGEKLLKANRDNVRSAGLPREKL